MRRYEPRSMRVPVGNRTLRIAVPAAREWLRRGTWARSLGREDEPPYWVEVWPSSMAAVWALARCDRLVMRLAGKNVLDLGCGLGLPGVAAASLGAHVTFADREPDALAYATWNGRRLLRAGGAVRASMGDWCRIEFEPEFDVVVLADVTYRALHHARLVQLVTSALRPAGVVLHADPMRPESTAFLAQLDARLGAGGSGGAWGLRPTTLGPKRVSIRLAVTGAPGGAASAWSAVLGLGPCPAKIGSPAASPASGSVARPQQGQRSAVSEIASS